MLPVFILSLSVHSLPYVGFHITQKPAELEPKPAAWQPLWFPLNNVVLSVQQTSVHLGPGPGSMPSSLFSAAQIHLM